MVSRDIEKILVVLKGGGDAVSSESYVRRDEESLEVRPCEIIIPSGLAFGFVKIDEHTLCYRSGTSQSQINRLKVMRWVI